MLNGEFCPQFAVSKRTFCVPPVPANVAFRFLFDEVTFARMYFISLSIPKRYSCMGAGISSEVEMLLSNEYPITEAELLSPDTITKPSPSGLLNT